MDDLDICHEKDSEMSVLASLPNLYAHPIRYHKNISMNEIFSSVCCFTMFFYSKIMISFPQLAQITDKKLNNDTKNTKRPAKRCESHEPKFIKQDITSNDLQI